MGIVLDFKKAKESKEVDKEIEEIIDKEKLKWWLDGVTLGSQIKLDRDFRDLLRGIEFGYRVMQIEEK